MASLVNMKQTPTGICCDVILAGISSMVILFSSETAVNAQVLPGPLIKNGSFENPVNSGEFLSPIIPTGWSVNSGSGPVLVDTALVNYANYLPATDGAQVVVLYNTTISQSVSLEAGEQYLLTLDLSPRQYDGSSPQDASLNFSISEGSQSITNFFFVPAGTTTWIHERFTFTADNNGVYNLSFGSPPLQRFESVVDNVVLTTVPEPRAVAFLALGIVVAGLLSSRKQKGRFPNGIAHELLPVTCKNTQAPATTNNPSACPPSPGRE